MPVLSGAQSGELDRRLVDEFGYPLDALIEVAGRAVAEKIRELLVSKTALVLCVCGPGNNGLDAVCSARWLMSWGYSDVRLWIPKMNQRLLSRLRQFGGHVHVYTSTPDMEPGMVVDGLFGFSFQPPVRSPFDLVISQMSHWHRNGSFMFCIDTPSGWSVDDPKPEEAGVEPDFILALTNLKPVSQTFADKGTRVELCDAVVPSFLHKDLGLR